ncbi:MAG: hypothetical protein JWM80_2374 [Cyanobacteria bacterium RYN_339]|nr:hypothetical protein [Cyanobacteria bacterium RYN_339]
MKIFIQTETQTAEAAAEARPRQLILETAAAAPAVQAALEAIAARLGAITVVPPAAHEANLKAILPRDLAAESIAPGQGAEGAAVLKVVRTTGEAEVIGLRYEVSVTPG